MSKRQRVTPLTGNGGHLSALRPRRSLARKPPPRPADPAEEKRSRYAREHNLGKIVMGRLAHRDAGGDVTLSPTVLPCARAGFGSGIVALEEPLASARAQTPDNRPLKRNGVGRFRVVCRRGALRHHHAYRYAVVVTLLTPPIW